jgi:hypothetical protein
MRQGPAEALLGRQSVQGDAVAQGGLTKYLRIIRVKHIQAETGDALATAVRAWFVAKEETISVDLETVTETVSLSEERELMDWRYQVDSGIHHMLLFYAE